MSDPHRIETLIRQLRTDLAEVRQLRARGVKPTLLRPREREIVRSQRHLALAVRDLLSETHELPARSHRLGGDAQ